MTGGVLLEKDPQTEQLLELVRQFKETKEIAMTVHLPIRVVQTRLALQERYDLSHEVSGLGGIYCDMGSRGPQGVHLRTCRSA